MSFPQCYTIRRLAMCLLVVAGILSASQAGIAAPAEVPPPGPITAQAAVVVDAETGRELWTLRPDQQMFPASLTKMMTGYLAVEAGDLDRTVTISRKTANVAETGLYLEEGERIRLRDLLMGTLIWSANDAAEAIAEAVSGERDKFLTHMNDQAKAWGATGTRFVNPHGLHEEQHYSTARDLAKIAVHCMKEATFREIVATKSFRMARPEYVEPEDPAEKTLMENGADKIRKYAPRTYTNRNRLLASWDKCTGIKTGYTRQAGKCLAASATCGQWQAIVVVLKSENAWHDAQTLLEWAARNFEMRRVVDCTDEVWRVPVHDGEAKTVQAAAACDLSLLLPIGSQDPKVEAHSERAEAPVTRGDEMGSLTVVVDGERRAEAKLIATQDVGLSLWGQVKAMSLPGGLETILLCLAAGVLLLGASAKTARARRGRFAPPK